MGYWCRKDRVSLYLPWFSESSSQCTASTLNSFLLSFISLLYGHVLYSTLNTCNLPVWVQVKIHVHDT